MKFGIRFADQIVGLVVILALASVAIVIVMMGRTQGWFKNKDFTTVLETAGGLSKNMAVQYKGFTIGNVKDFRLNGDNVEVVFTIHGNYTEQLAKEGSIMELQVGIVSLLPSQFIFHPGRGELLEKGTGIPLAGTREAIDYQNRGLATYTTPTEDNIAKLMNQVNSLLASLTPTIAELTPILADLKVALGPAEEGSEKTEISKLIVGINTVLTELSDALGPGGTDDTEIGKTIGSINALLTELKEALGPGGTDTTEIGKTIGGINALLTDLNAELRPGETHTTDIGKTIDGVKDTLDKASGLLDTLNEPGGVITMVDSYGEISILIAQLRTMLISVNDLLEGINNDNALSYLLRRNNTDRSAENQTTGPRNIQF